MTSSKLLLVLVVIFGSCTWIGTNSVWMQLPLLTSELPEGWNLPSYLSVVVQLSQSPEQLPKSYYALLLFTVTLINAQMNGIIPSISSYAALPYSQIGSFIGSMIMLPLVDIAQIFKSAPPCQ
ncbi:hypothetical protein ANCDUO_13056 [Ancylostoma duodenale]|uniref:Riboflavin transporter n=1 Tax=Ancylostoma duodenale TaxID=51022 RepID=A0A0C2GI51_9BILA|nr:hypothetical protein ANCDUO_13056 [Ancylostoma duodenale]